MPPTATRSVRYSHGITPASAAVGANPTNANAIHRSMFSISVPHFGRLLPSNDGGRIVTDRQRLSTRLQSAPATTMMKINVPKRHNVAELIGAMFTGIIEALGDVRAIAPLTDGRELT